MRNLFFLASAILLATGCHRETPEQQLTGCGAIAVTASASGDVVTKTGEQSGITLETPATADFTLTIKGDAESEVAEVAGFEQTWSSLAGYDPDEQYYTAGWYDVTIECGDKSVEGYNKPYFTATKAVQVLDRNRTVNVELTATLGNAIVEVHTTKNFRNYFPTREFKLTTATNEFELTEGGSAEYLFIAAQSNVKIDCTCIRQANMAAGTKETLATQTIPTVSPKTRYLITYDLTNIGSVAVTISLNEEIIDTITVDQELNPNA